MKFLLEFNDWLSLKKRKFRKCKSTREEQCQKAAIRAGKVIGEIKRERKTESRRNVAHDATTTTAVDDVDNDDQRDVLIVTGIIILNIFSVRIEIEIEL